MRAIVVDRWMPPSELTVSEVPDPELVPGALEIEVRAAGCNFFDTLIVQGKYQQKPEFPFTPGGEIGGVVRAVGSGVRSFKPGDRVLSYCGLGGFAERAVLPAEDCYKLPSEMSFEEACAIPIIYPTSYAALVDRGALKAGETLLVHAAAGGVGLAAVQLGKALGARVIATAGGPEKCEIAQREGADVVIDYRKDDFLTRVMDETDGRGADVIYDSVGGETTDKSLKCIAWNGRLLVIGFAGGSIPEIKANRIMLKNIAVVGLHWSAYPQKDPGRIPEIFGALFDLYAAGKIAPLIYKTYALDEVPEALAALGGRKTYGKVVVAP